MKKKGFTINKFKKLMRYIAIGIPLIGIPIVLLGVAINNTYNKLKTDDAQARNYLIASIIGYIIGYCIIGLGFYHRSNKLIFNIMGILGYLVCVIPSFVTMVKYD